MGNSSGKSKKNKKGKEEGEENDQATNEQTEQKQGEQATNESEENKPAEEAANETKEDKAGDEGGGGEEGKTEESKVASRSSKVFILVLNGACIDLKKGNFFTFISLKLLSFIIIISIISFILST